MDDQDLLAALAGDLDGSFEALVERYGGPLYRFAFRLSGSAEDAEESAQDALVRAYRALAEYEPARIRALQLRPWLYRITLNVVRNRTRRRRLELVPFDGDVPASEGMDGPERSLAAAERRAEMAALLRTLPERYRVPVTLRHIEDLSYEEIGEALGQPVGTVKSNVSRGISALREMLKDEIAV